MATEEDLDSAFKDGSVFKAADEDLDRFLRHLCSGHVQNEMIRAREMNRCQVINTIKNFRFIRSIEAQNKIFSVLVIVLSVLAIGISVYSIRQSNETTEQIARLVRIQQDHLELTRKLNASP